MEQREPRGIFRLQGAQWVAPSPGSKVDGIIFPWNVIKELSPLGAMEASRYFPLGRSVVGILSPWNVRIKELSLLGARIAKRNFPLGRSVVGSSFSTMRTQWGTHSSWNVGIKDLSHQGHMWWGTLSPQNVRLKEIFPCQASVANRYFSFGRCVVGNSLRSEDISPL